MIGRVRLFTMLSVAGLLAAVTPRAVTALETDQFTVPPAPLADIGPELAAEVMRRIDTAAARVNARAAAHAERAASSTGFWQRHHLRERERALSEQAMAREVYRQLAGPWVPECRIEQWIRRQRFARGPARFEVTPANSAYGPSPFHRSPLILSLSPTVNVYGVYLGGDKVGHLFQQGHEYFEQFAREEARLLARGEPAHAAAAAALAGAVRVGVGQERGFYGLALVGVYSNADLAANYAGLKLYLNLTRAVRVAGEVRPPLLVRRDGRWAYNADARPNGSRDAFLRPFISDHFNEALNPSQYRGLTRRTVRDRWHRRAASWVAFYGSTPGAEADRLRRLATWHGEAYGHSGFDALVTALDTCFDAEPITPHSPVAVTPRRRGPAKAEPDAGSRS